MQFLPATFGEFAVDADLAQPVSPYDPADAIYTAAQMLCADGARSGNPAGINQAIFAYNHASWYVTEVLSWAARYASPSRSATAAPLTAGMASRP
jgi:membrane-bound lytic murein transglycosylase B